MNCLNYAHSLDERDRIQRRAESERGYVAGSFRTSDAGIDSLGSHLYLCTWLWRATPLPAHLG